MARCTTNKQLPVVPDRLDLRARPYTPSVALVPPPRLLPSRHPPVLQQGTSSACTGFALATAANYLLRRHRGARQPLVSPFMLYSMARRYDEFPGAAADAGSSVRGALKGWYHHGACRDSLWTGLDMPKAKAKAADDWWLDAARRPLGAYYRVDTRSVTDMHVALCEVGVLCASAVLHDGWFEGDSLGGVRRHGPWQIPRQQPEREAGGHAFVILGYDERGFLIQNSWGVEWGWGGLAILDYQDWLDHAMDCWVAQLGVATEVHEDLARATTLRSKGGRVQLAGGEVLRDRELTPFVVSLDRDGRLRQSGRFRTGPEDLEALVTLHASQARRRFGLGEGEPMDVALYAHGGLVDERAAAAIAARWVPALYEARLFPVFVMWQSDLWSALVGRFAALAGGEAAAGGLRRWWDRRVERLLAPVGSVLWREMKRSAGALSDGVDSGLWMLWEHARRVGWSGAAGAAPVRVHLIGHSAGAIVMARWAERICAGGGHCASVNMLAPALRVDEFEAGLLRLLRDGGVAAIHEFHLADAAEQADRSCEALLGYGRSLLYLVSQAFEGGGEEPVLGMERYWNAAVPRWGEVGRRMRVWVAPGEGCRASTHGGFDEDAATRASVIAAVRG
jgi:hypothetical protein